MIRKATFQDIKPIMLITKACALYMQSKGIFQWNEYYPNKSAFLNDVEREELYVLEKEKQVIGCIVVSTFMDQEYQPIQWLTNNDKNIYIHRLCVHPDHQGLGFAQRLMDFAETHAKENSFSSIRLDTFSQNKRNQMFYEKRGYRRLDDIYFPKQSEHPFHCYELVL